MLKSVYYAQMGIPQYWIVDPDRTRLTILRGPDRDTYKYQVVVSGGERWEIDEPFDIALDPADFC
jgi:Uma2 family endonuclease